MDSRDSSGGIVGDHSLDDFTVTSAETGPSLTSATALSPPEGPESPSGPSDHGFGLDDDKRTPPALPDTAQENPDYSVPVFQRRVPTSTAEDLKLMAEGDVLEDQ